jgi:hypothetical protein
MKQSKTLQAIAAALSPSDGSEPVDRLEPLLSDSLKLRKNTSIACYACRQRRSRACRSSIFPSAHYSPVLTAALQCSGNTPCKFCLPHGTGCVRDETNDKRQKTAIHRKIESPENDQKLPDDLLAAIPTADTASWLRLAISPVVRSQNESSTHTCYCKYVCVIKRGNLSHENASRETSGYIVYGVCREDHQAMTTGVVRGTPGACLYMPWRFGNHICRLAPPTESDVRQRAVSTL